MMGQSFVQCDDNEQAYLKVLMDEIFGRDNFINSIVISMSNMSGTKVRHAYTGKRFPKIKEYVLLFVKSKDFYHLNVPKENKETWDKEYNYIIPNITREKYLELRDFIVNNELEKAKKIVGTLKLCTLNEYSNINNIKIDDNFKFDNMWRIVGTKPNESILKICKTK
ncbi:DNA methyltransferase [Brachyspira hyodysenteriae]|uniref:DNA methyltransferase n=1 Tax=Brachyspira hyodysenteriae TaxID=159 RepID=UPI0022CE0A63|nr:DNA methyltransferase [Brachyspira hyodysenteriae]MCZ9940005.1 DNA methyltransferase [Brachyspira hyodysenteriae]